MKGRKYMAMLLAAVAAAGMLSVSAFAHGGRHGGGRHAGANHAYCPVEDCVQTGSHTHDGVTYRAHQPGDGHGYHANSSCYYN